MEVLSNRHTIIIEFYDYRSYNPAFYPKAKIKATYNNDHTVGTPIEIRSIFKIHPNTRNEKWALSKNMELSFNELNNSFLLLNAPVGSNELINITTYYMDGSLARNTIITKGVNNNVLPRAYYNIRQDNKYVSVNQQNNTLELRHASLSNWLIEYQGSGSYAIMHQETRKVLGIRDGKIGLYDWDYQDKDLHWHMDFSASNAKLYNLGHQAFLSTNSSNSQIIFEFNNSSTFLLEKRLNIDPILPKEKIYLSNRSNGNVLSQEMGKPTLKPKKTTTQQTLLKYRGCLRYAIYDPYEQKNLYFDTELQWSKSKATNWLMTKTDSGYFTLTTEGKPLYAISPLGNEIGVDFGSNPTQDDPPYQFAIIPPYSLANQLILHYTFDTKSAKDHSPYARDGLSHGVSYPGIEAPDKERGTFAYFGALPSHRNYIDTRVNFHPKNHNGDMTISLWMKTPGGEHWNVHEPVLIQAGAFSLSGRYDGTIRAWLHHAKLSSSATSGGGIDVNDAQWHHIVQVIDTREQDISLKLYIDGSLVSEKISTRLHLYDPQKNTIIGRNFNGIRKYQGALSDIKIWGTALTQEEVAAEYNPEKGNDLIAHYKFEGNAYDASDYLHHGRTYGKISYINDGTIFQSEASRHPESERKSMQFNGTTTRMEADIKVPATKYTISLWFKTDKQNGYIYFGASGQQQTTRGIYLLDGRIHVQGNVNNSSMATPIGQSYADNQWHHIVYTMGKSIGGRKLYVDGFQKGETQPINKVFSTSRIILGRSPSDSKMNFAGLMDNVKIWKKTLTPKEILKEFNSTIHTYCRPPLASQSGELFLKHLTTQNAKKNINYTNNAYPLSSYTHYADKYQTLEVAQRSTFNLKATINEKASYSHVKVWVDWNKDKTFDNANESYLLLRDITTKNNIDFTKNITVPASAKQGATRMRVRYAANLWSGDMTPCGKLNNTTTYDFNINVLKGEKINYCKAHDTLPNEGRHYLNHLFLTTANEKHNDLFFYHSEAYPTNGYMRLIPHYTITPGSTIHLYAAANDEMFSYRVKAWGDWNADGDFNDPGEEIFAIGSAFQNHFSEVGNISKPIKIPLSVKPGTTRIRIRYAHAWGQEPTPCGQLKKSLTYDVELKIVPGNSIDIKNLALNKPARQSSYFWKSLSPDKAVNGKITGNHYDITHTQVEHQPWWEVDLGRLADITTIRLFNRMDCCKKRLTNYHILVSEKPFTSNKLSETQSQSGVSDFHQTGQTDSYEIRAINRKARYVRIQLTDYGILSLSEVQVLGKYANDNTSLGTQGLASETGNNERNLTPDSDAPASLTIYPNPFNNHFDMEFNLQKQSNVEYKIFNLSGNLIQSDVKLFQKGNQIWHINTSRDMPTGIYILLIGSNEWQHNRKIIVNK